MSSKDITDLIIAFQAIITLCIAWRAFYLYGKSRNEILLIVGVSMSIIFVGGVAGLVGDYLLTSSAFDTFWFRYLGQIVSYLFIFFISLPGAEHHLHFLKRLNLTASALLLVLLLLTPLLPPIPGVTFTQVLSGSRAVICLAVFLSYYFVIFSMKGTRFSWLMCAAFLFIATGIVVYTLKFAAPNPLPYDYIGDSIRAFGLSCMLAAFFVG